MAVEQRTAAGTRCPRRAELTGRSERVGVGNVREPRRCHGPEWEARLLGSDPAPPLPTEQEVRFRPADWPLPRPTAIHHIVEDFLTDWTAPVSHILPLRRFLENCLGTDLRGFYAGSVRSLEDSGPELEGGRRPDRACPMLPQDAHLETQTQGSVSHHARDQVFTDPPRQHACQRRELAGQLGDPRANINPSWMWAISRPSPGK